jgi:hypothetical protein
LTIKFCVAISLGLPTVAISGTQKLEERADIGGVLSLSLPTDLQVLKDNGDSIDFDVYYVMENKKSILTVYLGNAPSFAQTGDEKVIIGGCTALSRVSMTGDSVDRDVLLTLQTEDLFPHFIHLFYRKLSARQTALSDTIINSLELSGGRKCS